MKSIFRFSMLVTLAAMCLTVTGCAGRSHYYATSVVQYLYPDKKEFVEAAAVPHLLLPLRVGVAFVPAERNAWQHALSEQEKMELMKRIAAEFKPYPFVKGIELIPTPYLTVGGSFTNLDQIRTMYGVDVIVLLSYDQVQHTDEDFLSISYWTLIGAYTVRGEKNDTSTMLDAAVYHIPSRKLLFRAPGTSRIKGAATPVNLSEQLRKDSKGGFDEATVQLVANLKDQLEAFKVNLKESPHDFKIERRQGYTGGGCLGGVCAGVVVLAGVVSQRHGRNRKK